MRRREGSDRGSKETGMATEVRVRKSNRGRKPKPQGPRGASVCMRCEIAYRDWLRDFAKAEGTTPSKIVDAALADLARQRGFTTPPKR